ncbi:MAG: hypothetical protein CMI09_05930 [Oceanospirillaceae bacterium]|nr:hypothetical protein [Oceanospirillaceae bacterium]|tara:strand:- start:1703 stop:2797 length:1095 start_codon:yes stop_codon:yes gene_type:complete
MHNKNKPNVLSLTIASLMLAGAVSSAQAEIKTTNTFSGYVKMDVLFNSENDGTNGLRDQALLTLNQDEAEDEEGELYMSAWESRLKFAHSSTGTPVGDLKAVIEGDMYSGATQNIFNLRHAYFQQDNLTLGQTWTTFMDLGALAETADFGGPAARIFTRQPVIRYAIPMGAGKLELAAEKPRNSPDPKTPDLIAKYTAKMDFGHLTAGVLAQKINVDDGTKDDSATAVAGRFSGRFNFAGDNIKFALISGNGLGGYMNFGDVAAYDFSGENLELSKQTGYKLAFQHVFTSSLRSTIRVAKTTSEIDGNDMGDFSSMHVNLIYNPYKPLKYGAEVIRATKSKAEGNALTDDLKLSRVHLFAKLAF